MILPYQTIKRLCLEKGLITPFLERHSIYGMTAGASAAGYDVRVAQRTVVRAGYTTLASTIERFRVPDDLTFKIEDKSTWVRHGLYVGNTTAEPGWEGFLTLELTYVPLMPTGSRTTYCGSDDLIIKAGTPIAQVVFHRLEEPTELPYAGRYQGQERGPQPARYEEAAA